MADSINDDGWGVVAFRRSEDGPGEVVKAFIADTEVAAGECALPVDDQRGVVIVGRNQFGESIGMVVTMALAEELAQHVRDTVTAHLRRKLHGH